MSIPHYKIKMKKHLENQSYDIFNTKTFADESYAYLKFILKNEPNHFGMCISYLAKNAHENRV